MLLTINMPAAATNAITGIATAYMDSIPMVIISGQVASTMVGTDAFQETDMTGISRPIMKLCFTIGREIPILETVRSGVTGIARGDKVLSI